MQSTEEEPFQTAYTALWKKPLNSILHDALASASGTVLKYIPSSVLEKLRLTRNCMGYRSVRWIWSTKFASANLHLLICANLQLSWPRDEVEGANLGKFAGPNLQLWSSSLHALRSHPIGPKVVDQDSFEKQVGVSLLKVLRIEYEGV